MSIAIITGSGGLIGAESVKFFSKKFDKIIGIDNNSRQYFFGKLASVNTNINLLKKEIKNYSHQHIDIRNNKKIERIFKNYKKILKYIEVPIVADIHFHYKRAIEAANSGANCLRINPGNIGSKEKVQEILKPQKIIIVL